LREKFYCFPLQKIILGIQFAYKDDAESFHQLVNQFCFSGEPKEVAKEEKKKLGLHSTAITKPKTFGKKEYEGWNPITQTFNLKKLPDSIKKLLKKAGVKPKSLKDKDTALKIFKGLITQIDFSSTREAEHDNESDNTSEPSV
jgi:hypothetical protein